MIDKDIEIGKIFVNSEKSHVSAGRAPVGHEQSPNSSTTEGGNETVSGGKVGDSGVHVARAACIAGWGRRSWATVKSRSRTACSSSAIVLGVAPIRLLRGAVAIGIA